MRHSPSNVSRYAFVLLTFVLLSFGLLFAATQLTGKVIGISDGDTILLLINKQQVKIRLNGIDTPEKGQAFGERAKQFTSRMVFGKTVTVKVATTDRYGRSVGEVYINDTISLNRMLVDSGYAWWYRQYAPHDKMMDSLENAARMANKGLWADKNPVPPWEWRRSEKNRRVGTVADSSMKDDPADTLPVYRTMTGKKYHKTGCRYLSKDSYIVNLGKAKAEGLKPCGVCKP